MFTLFRFMNGSQLKQLRLISKLTQEELGKQIGVFKQTIYRWETSGRISKVYQKILIEHFKKLKL